MMEHWAKKTIVGSGVLRLAADFRDGGTAILMYHSVVPDPSLQTDFLGELAHSEAVFRAQMELLSRDYHPISLDEALKYLRTGERLPKRSVVITFDDGYADNYEVATPILNQFSIPATFYVIVDCLENRNLPWPSRLRFAFRKSSLMIWTDSFGQSWSLADAAKREEAFRASCNVCCRLTGTAQQQYVQQIEQELHSPPTRSASLMMTYGQMQGLIRNGHTVGSHTLTHPNMAYVSENEARREFDESKRRLAAQLGVPIKHFSYPCPALTPHWNQRTAEQSRAAGYESAVTTDKGLTRRGDDALCLKRVRPTKSLEGLQWSLEKAFAGMSSQQLR